MTLFLHVVSTEAKVSLSEKVDIIYATENIGHHPVTKHIKRLEHHIPLRTNRET